MRESRRVDRERPIKWTAREQLRKRQLLGLLLVALIILVVALFRADLHSVFPPGWWRF
jgi:hypothetical protein